MIQNIGKICNASGAYRNVTHHHISKKQLPTQAVINKVTIENKSQVN